MIVGSRLTQANAGKRWRVFFADALAAPRLRAGAGILGPRASQFAP